MNYCSLQASFVTAKCSSFGSGMSELTVSPPVKVAEANISERDVAGGVLPAEAACFIKICPFPQELRGWWRWRWRSRAPCRLWSRRCWRICRTWRNTRANTRSGAHELLNSEEKTLTTQTTDAVQSVSSVLPQFVVGEPSACFKDDCADERRANFCEFMGGKRDWCSQVLIHHSFIFNPSWQTPHNLLEILLQLSRVRFLLYLYAWDITWINLFTSLNNNAFSISVAELVNIWTSVSGFLHNMWISVPALSKAAEVRTHNLWISTRVKTVWTCLEKWSEQKGKLVFAHRRINGKVNAKLNV